MGGKADSCQSPSRPFGLERPSHCSSGRQRKSPGRQKDKRRGCLRSRPSPVEGTGRKSGEEVGGHLGFLGGQEGDDTHRGEGTVGWQGEGCSGFAGIVGWQRRMGRGEGDSESVRTGFAMGEGTDGFGEAVNLLRKENGTHSQTPLGCNPAAGAGVQLVLGAIPVQWNLLPAALGVT